MRKMILSALRSLLPPRSPLEMKCVCWCPKCRAVLNDGRSSCYESEGMVNYLCGKCDFWSVWDFGPPAPIYLREGSATLDVKDRRAEDMAE